MKDRILRLPIVVLFGIISLTCAQVPALNAIRKPSSTPKIAFTPSPSNTTVFATAVDLTATEVHSPFPTWTPTATKTPVPTDTTEPTATPIPILIKQPDPMDIRNMESVLRWFNYALITGDITTFDQLISDGTIQYGSGLAGGRDTISKNEFLGRLLERIPNHAVCVGYTGDDDAIMIFTNGWEPDWDHGGKSISDELTFTLMKVNGRYSIITAYFTPASTILEVVDGSSCLEP